MRYVILRDDDTNAFTPVECLERLYRPFLERGMPVNLATIPEVSTHAVVPSNGRIEGFLFAKPEVQLPTMPLAQNQALVSYLKANPGFHIVQHGCHHDPLEFDLDSTSELARRLDRGANSLRECGFSVPETFVAPYDKLSRAAYAEVTRRFRVVSTGWFELQRLPRAWWPAYLIKRARSAPHWRVGRTLLLSHPGCLLSCYRDPAQMRDEIVRQVNSRRLTVLVTHWWEYFRKQETDGPLLQLLHELAAYLANRSDIQVISFSDLLTTPVDLN
jgi:hypothetical protein